MSSPVPSQPAAPAVPRPWTRHPALPWVVPFVVLIASIGIAGAWHMAPRAEAFWRLAAVALACGYAWRKGIVALRPTHLLGTIAVGVAVFAIWIGPDLLIPTWRSSVVFQNSITGKVTAGLPPAARSDAFVLMMRALRAVLFVPIAEELFWRGWLPRVIARSDWESVPLGEYTRAAFAITAVLFAVEHGPFWEVGLAAGIIYNWWMWRTRSLADLIWAHGITNGLLSVYVLVAGKWEYWP